jgi:hypothetical protein
MDREPLARGDRIMTAPYDFQAYAVGICTASVCTALTDEQTVERMNAEHPTGIDSPWAISTDPTFASGEPNPTPCEDMADTHRHILFNC